MTDQRQPIEADGVNVIDCGIHDFSEPSMFGDYRPGFDIRLMIPVGRYRVLLERIEE